MILHDIIKIIKQKAKSITRITIKEKIKILLNFVL